MFNFAVNPNKGGSPPRESIFKDKIVLFNIESFLEKIWLIFLVWLELKNKIIAKERHLYTIKYISQVFILERHLKIIQPLWEIEEYVRINLSKV